MCTADIYAKNTMSSCVNRGVQNLEQHYDPAVPFLLPLHSNKFQNNPTKGN